ncbi:hypothetical protein K435DRAFT_902296 [Dendrothele bispora CBS 962.96]|uniref:Uncharacterized protein n=1 Tax=Dendrothele bispora (strain CBS 962.96) TaxID=1314807 RepID=A0A4S8LX08_DENBC|nr:hypothetical protein K435DRAFT_902296 [Dendrothele bispora CBS 962.96]
MGFLVAYTSLASTAPNHEKGKGNGKGETYEERYRTRLQTPSVLDSDEVGQTHESIFKGPCVDLIRSFIHLPPCSSAHYCESPKHRGKCKEGEYEKESTVQEPLERSSQKFFEYHWALDYSIETDDLLFYSSYFDYNYEVLMLMKESLEIKGKTLDKDLYYERPLATRNKQAPRRIPKQRKEFKKKFISVHRVRECELRKTRQLNEENRWTQLQLEL